MFFEIKRYFQVSKGDSDECKLYFRNKFYIDEKKQYQHGGINIDLQEVKNISVNLLNEFMSRIQFIRVYQDDLTKEGSFFQHFREEFISSSKEKKYFIFIGDYSIAKNITELGGGINILKARGLDGTNVSRFIDLTKYKITENLEKSIAVNSFKDEIRKCILFFYLLEIYEYSELLIAQEFLDFHFMKLHDSSIAIPGGHSESILSFSFHSEMTALLKANETIHNIIDLFKLSKVKKTLSYKVLLIDDYANKELRTFKNTELKLSKMNLIVLFLASSILRINENYSSFEKYQISFNDEVLITELKELLCKNFSLNYPQKEDLPDNNPSLYIYKNGTKIFEVYFHTKTNVADALNSDDTYDLILLDYLFNVSNKGSENIFEENSSELDSNNLHYGISFLEKIAFINKRNEMIKLRQSPLNRYWILPISTFSHAMIDEMQNMGISFVNKEYYLSRGADPINTPCLFLSKFLQILERQIEFSLNGIYDFNTIWTQRINRSLSELINQKFSINEKRGTWIREMDEVSVVFSNIQKLKDDENNNSLFAKSINILFNDEEVKHRLRILAHYRELMYQLSYHPIQNNENVIIETQKLNYLMNKHV